MTTTFRITFLSTPRVGLFTKISPLFQCFKNHCGGFIKITQLLGETARQLQWWNGEITVIVKLLNDFNGKMVKYHATEMVIWLNYFNGKMKKW